VDERVVVFVIDPDEVDVFPEHVRVIVEAKDVLQEYTQSKS
jgi:hypothetical protein